MAVRELTQRQKEILIFIEEYMEMRGYPPTIRQIGERFGIKSPNGVADHLKALARKGAITHDKHTARGIVLTHKTEKGIPLVGRVAAGTPILAAENIDDFITIERMLPIDGKCFALKVKGDSMIDDGIHNGDIVVVQPQKTAQNGEIVVAIIEDEATVKRYYKERNAIRLQPANSAYQPILSTNVELCGRVVGVIRRV